MNKVITLIAALLLFVNTSFAATAVSGQIRTNTTWTKAGSPYICTGLIEVDSFSTLTIEPGTVIDLDEGLIAYKSLVFQYNIVDTTVIKSHGSLMTPTITIQNPNLNDTILVKHCKFISAGIAIYLPKSTFIVDECVFNGSTIQWQPTDTPAFIFTKNKCTNTDFHFGLFGIGMATAGKVIIDNSSFDNTIVNGNVMSTKSVDITNNIFKNETFCIQIEQRSTGGILISENIFYKSTYPIYQYAMGGALKIISNVFFENDQAIFIAFPNDVDTIEIRNNTMYNNNVGVSFYYNYKTNWPPLVNIKAPIIEGNCIYNNKYAGFAWNTTNDISIGANWWGSIDTNKIDSAIIDNKDDFKIGHVNYKPYLTISNPSCKTYTPPLGTEALPAHKNEIQLFPNPFLNTLVIKSGSSIKTVMLYNIVGEIVYKSTAQNNSISVNTEEFPAGVYLYKIITADNYTHTGKVIKQ